MFITVVRLRFVWRWLISLLQMCQVRNTYATHWNPRVSVIYKHSFIIIIIFFFDLSQTNNKCVQRAALQSHCIDKPAVHLTSCTIWELALIIIPADFKKKKKKSAMFPVYWFLSFTLNRNRIFFADVAAIFLVCRSSEDFSQIYSLSFSKTIWIKITFQMFITFQST